MKELSLILQDKYNFCQLLLDRIDYPNDEELQKRHFIFNEWDYEILLSDKNNKNTPILNIMKIDVEIEKYSFFTPKYQKQMDWLQQYALKSFINDTHSYIYEYIMSEYKKNNKVTYEEYGINISISNELYYIFYHLIKECNNKKEDLENIKSVKCLIPFRPIMTYEPYKSKYVK